MKHQIFTFSAICHDPKYLQSHTIWQNKHLNLTNFFLYFKYDIGTYVDKINSNVRKMIIFDDKICLITLYSPTWPISLLRFQQKKM